MPSHLILEDEIQRAASRMALENEWPDTLRMRRDVYDRLCDELGMARTRGPADLRVYVCTGALTVEIDDSVEGLFWIGNARRPPEPDPEEMLHL